MGTPSAGPACPSHVFWEPGTPFTLTSWSLAQGWVGLLPCRAIMLAGGCTSALRVSVLHVQFPVQFISPLTTATEGIIAT